MKKLITTFFLLNVILPLSLLQSPHVTFSAADSSENGEVDDESAFSYVESSGKGPRRWGEMDPHWQACKQGSLQSPIDLVDKRVEVVSNLGKLNRGYKPAPASVKNRGHDITVLWKGDAGEIKINGSEYKLLQCHWHSPSEHTFNGSRFELEVHLVHKSYQGNLAVVAIVYNYGRPDRMLSKLFHHIRSVERKKDKEIGIVNPGDIKVGSSRYYRYIGSLTVPPCTQGVIWTIVNKVRTVSRDQVRALREAVHDGFEANARPVQPLDGRPVYEYRP